MSAHTRRYWIGIVSLAALILMSRSAGAAAADRWARLADSIFTPVAQAGTQATNLLPLSFAEDGSGFLWAGGEAGLLRWDGYRFKAYVAEGAHPDGLRNHSISKLHCDRAGVMWVGTTSGELARYDPLQDRFVDLPLDPAGQGIHLVSGFDDDGDGGLWIATNAGLFHTDAAGQAVDRLRYDPHHAGSLPDNDIQAVLRDGHGRLWVGGRSGLARQTKADGPFARLALPAAPGETTEVSHLTADGAGRIWVGTRHHGAFVMQPDGTNIRPVAATAGLEIMAITEVAPGEVWLGTFGGGVCRADGATGTATCLHHDALVPAGLASDNVYALYRDRSGLVWVGTTRGISRHSPSPGVMTVFGDPGRKSGLTTSDATAILARPDGKLWVGSQTDGIDIVDPAGRVAAVLPVPRVFNMIAGPTGQVLVGTRSGLFSADPQTLRVTRLDIPGRRVNAGVLTLFTADGVVWVGDDDDGLWGVQLSPDGPAKVIRHDNVPRLTNTAVYSLALAPDGRLAIGTSEGFNLLDRTSGAIEQFLPRPGDPHTHIGGQITSLATDRQGRLWVGTDDAGLDILIGRTEAGAPRFRHLGVGDGLPNAAIDKMLVDRHGRIWASTDGGLAVIDPASLAVRALRAADGVAIETYWNNAGDITPQGDLIFGGMGGMTVIRPDAVTAWRYQPPVVLTSVQAGGVPWLAGDGGEATGPTIAPTANSLSVEFAALDFSTPEANRYRYRLDGYDRDWISADSAHRVASYTNLPPGDYSLEVEGSNREGSWSAVPASLPVHVLAAWYQTGWFRLCEGLLAGLFIVALVRWRTAVLRQRQQELEQLVDQRTAELTRSQQELMRIAYVDSLTGLPNRRAFNEKIAAIIGASSPQQFALMLIDLDGFKGVNDTLGHDVGDLVLVDAAERMRAAVRDGDFVARLGGDEFAILLLAMGEKADIAWVGNRIVASIAGVKAIKELPVKIGASAGAALFPQSGPMQQDLFKHADLALYEVKRAGGNGWRLFASVQAQPVEACAV